jgi:CHRD domain
MKLIKLTALTSLLFVFVLGMSSCEKIAEKKKTTDYQKNGIILTAAQVVPANGSTALGTLDVFYTKETRILNWSVIWTGLTGTVQSMHIHGPSPSGYATTNVIQNIIGTGGIATPNATLYPATGKFSGTLLADGVVVKEADLLNGFYYLDIHTTTNLTNGEIRAQIVFQ